MTKLNQVIAAEKGVKTRTERAITDLYHLLQKSALFTGLTRTYRPRDDEGERLPNETSPVQLRADNVLSDFAAALVPLLDITFTKDQANREASANVVVDGEVIIQDAPVTYLLFLEKQLAHVRTALSRVPVLDSSEVWEYDPNADVYRSTEVETTRTKKIPRNHVLAEATDRHPAQVQVWQEDVVVGYWSKVSFSGAMPALRLKEISDRLDRLVTAVKYAREEANGLEIRQRKCGDDIFAYLLA